ncbi:Thiol:disulfide interchange protein DsbD precursor, partial [Haemophilus influenzae]
ILLITNNFS